MAGVSKVFQLVERFRVSIWNSPCVCGCSLLENRAPITKGHLPLPSLPRFSSSSSDDRMATSSGDGKFLDVNFKVEGKVQGVFFRKYTREKARELGLVGWVQNAEDGSVIGRMQGTPEAITQMKHWLQHTGSPHSRISKAAFQDAGRLLDPQFRSFDVTR